MVIPLADRADEMLKVLAGMTGSTAIHALEGATLLGERGLLANRRIPGRVSAGGGCRLFDAADDTVALNLSRPADRELLPALFETDEFDIDDEAAVAARVRGRGGENLVERGRALGLAIAREHEAPPVPAAPAPAVAVALQRGVARGCCGLRRRVPRVIDLSALWAGPLAAHLLWLAGAEVVKVESRTRPDAMRDEAAFYGLLNQGKRSVALDFADASGRRALLSLIADADIVIEAARPRALRQLGIDAARLVAQTPGLIWITITGHGAEDAAADWVGFGDDCGVAAGLSAALRAASGRSGFVGDAIADPLTGISAAVVAWEAWGAGHGGRFGLALSGVVAHHLARTRDLDAEGFNADLAAWSAAAGQPFTGIKRRTAGAVAALGEHTRSCLAALPAFARRHEEHT